MKDDKKNEMIELFKSYGMSSPILKDDNEEKLYYKDLKKFKDDFENEGMTLIFDGKKENLKEEEIIIDDKDLQVKYKNINYTIYSILDKNEHYKNEYDLFCPQQLIFTTENLTETNYFTDRSNLLSNYTYLNINNTVRSYNNIINSSRYWDIKYFNHSSYNTDNVKNALVQGWSFNWDSQSVFEWGWRFNCTLSSSSLPYNFFENYNFYSSKFNYELKNINGYLTYEDNFKKEFINKNFHFTQINNTKINNNFYNSARNYKAREGRWGYIYMGQWENTLDDFNKKTFGKIFSYSNEYSDWNSYKPKENYKYKKLIDYGRGNFEYLYIQNIDVGYMNGYDTFDDFYNKYNTNKESNCVFRSFNVKYVYKKKTILRGK